MPLPKSNRLSIPRQPACASALRAIRSLTVAAAGALLLVAGPARAGLFDDEEARKAILDIRSQISRNDEAARASLVELQKLVVQQRDEIQQLRRTLVELNGRIEGQRADMAQLRGSQEQLARDLATAQQQIKNNHAALEARFVALEPQQITVDGKTFQVLPAERKAYDAALETLRSADFAGAERSLSSFLRRHPDSGYADSARFWLGSAQYGQKNYKAAIETFEQMVQAAPKHLRAPEALLAVANSQAESLDAKAARKTLEDLVKAYPDSDAAKAAKQRLSTSKS